MTGGTGSLGPHVETSHHPADQLSPDRSHTMRLEPQWVASIFAYGQLLWP